MQSIGGRVPNPRWTALATDEFVEWLMACHNDSNVVLRVYTHLMDTVDKLELVGPHVDRNPPAGANAVDEVSVSGAELDNGKIGLNESGKVMPVEGRPENLASRVDREADLVIRVRNH